ncbi:MAG: type II secretion system F family protein, partial [Candidatus Saccharimonadales bacterium]
MADFSYTARNKANSVQKGQISALDRASAVAALQKKELIPILVKPVNKPREIELPKWLGRKNKVKNQDIVIFTRQLATMTAAGVPLLRSLHILREQTDSKKLNEVLDKVTSDVEGGKSLADSLAVHPNTFSMVYVNMVRAGEAGGILDK